MMKAIIFFLAAALSLHAVVVNGPITPAPAGGGGSPTLIATDNFTAYADDQNLNTTGNWANVVGSYKIFTASGTKVAIGTAFGGTNGVYWIGAGTITTDQYSEITVYYSGSPSTLVGACVRASVGGGGNFYRAEWFQGDVYLQKYVAGTGSNITTVAFAMADNYKIRLGVTGTGSATRLTVDVDTGSGFTPLISAIDPGGTYLDTGGVGMSTDDNGTPTAVRSWRGGNL